MMITILIANSILIQFYNHTCHCKIDSYYFGRSLKMNHVATVTENHEHGQFVILEIVGLNGEQCINNISAKCTVDLGKEA